jgi:hypothetical protein
MSCHKQTQISPHPDTHRARPGWVFPAWKWALALPTGLLVVGLAAQPARAQGNLLKNPGFEETAQDQGAPPNWQSKGQGPERVRVLDKEAHEGRQCVSIPAHSAIEQRIDNAEPGAYVLRCWVKSEADQPVTLLLQDPDRPWSAYTCAEIQAPKDQWTQMEASCVLDQKGTLSLTLGGMSKDFRNYHGVAGEMKAPILADACELIRYTLPTPPRFAMWDANRELTAAPDWSAKAEWSPVDGQSHAFRGSPVFQARHLAGAVRNVDGALALYSIQGQTLKARATIVPLPPFKAATCALVRSNDRSGIRVASEHAERSYTAWLTPQGLVTIEASQTPRFAVRDCRLRYGLLPSFVGTDIRYSPPSFSESKEIDIPSTQWFVGLVDGYDSMLVTAWDSDSQAVSLGLSGEGQNRIIDSFSIATDKADFSISFVEHPGLWHQETLPEDWLGEYTPIAWERPFSARWMGDFFVSPGGRPYFGQPYMEYSFPIAHAKTRMWGVWFESWNYYPFFFDGPRTVLHFEKDFVPQGDAIIYFLEPAAADLYSPCEIVEQALGKEKAAALFDFNANELRKLSYSTPNEFIYDRPACATTTRLAGIAAGEKSTVGINLATHLYEFIREIRGRIDQYVSFFDQMQSYLDAQDKAHPEMHPYLAELQALVLEAKAKASEVYATPLSAVKLKTDSMKQLLLESNSAGFNCGRLDVRGTAGEQDDLCRRYGRLVIRLSQTAALQCGDSPAKALVAKHVWDESRRILRRPVRWEPRRTLYFFEL